MGEYVASQIVKTLIKKDIKVNGAEVLLLGITFKENCPDVRNTRIVDIIKSLEEFSIKVTVYDPWANPDEVAHEYHVTSLQVIPNQKFDAIVLGVAHSEFLQLDLNQFSKEKAIIYDVKGFLPVAVDGKL
jgi:UDP-N-acetyl-D-galactosamine dehydrogenase